MADFTIIGASGFIGSHLLHALEEANHSVFAPDRGDVTWVDDGRQLGHVLYCAGLTTDALARPTEAAQAHVGLLAEVLASARFDSLLYLSSSRVYSGAPIGAEDTRLTLDPGDPDDFFAWTKLAGEALCGNAGRADVRIARLSNVYGQDYGSGTFLSSIITDAVTQGVVTLLSGLDSAKDYVSVVDVCQALPQIAAHGTHRVYNVASGRNTTNGEIIESLAGASGCAWDVAPDAPIRRFPSIGVRRLRDEFGWASASVLDDMPALVASFRAHRTES